LARGTGPAAARPMQRHRFAAVVAGVMPVVIFGTVLCVDPQRRSMTGSARTSQPVDAPLPTPSAQCMSFTPTSGPALLNAHVNRHEAGERGAESESVDKKGAEGGECEGKALVNGAVVVVDPQEPRLDCVDLEEGRVRVCDKADLHGHAHPPISIGFLPLTFRPSTGELELSFVVVGAVEGFAYKIDVLINDRMSDRDLSCLHAGTGLGGREAGCVTLNFVAGGSNLVTTAFTSTRTAGDKVGFLIHVYDAFPGLATEMVLIGKKEQRLSVPAPKDVTKRGPLEHMIGVLPSESRRDRLAHVHAANHPAVTIEFDDSPLTYRVRDNALRMHVYACASICLFC